MGGQVQTVRKQEMNEERKVLAALDFMEELIFGHRQGIFWEIKTHYQLQKWRF